MTNILRIDASGRRDGSVSRELADHLIERLQSENSAISISNRDVAKGIPFVDETWIAANFTPADMRNDAQATALATSDAMIEELRSADILVISTPIYNFGVPAALKAWIDMVARAGETFKYTDRGPVGLLEGKKAYVVIASGGTEIGSDIDFLSGYLRHFLGFLGIDDVTLYGADQLMMKGDAPVADAKAAIASGAAV